MNVEERVLSALRCEQPDRVPVFLFLDPYGEKWYTRDPSYAEVLEACKELEDVVCDWGMPSGFFHSTVELSTDKNEMPDGVIEHVIHTPRGPISQHVAPNWRGGGAVKRWIVTPEDARRVLSIPYEPSCPDLAPFIRQRDRLRGRAVAQAGFPDPICSAGMIAEETLAIWTIEERDLLRELLDVCFDRICDEVRYCLEGGMGPIFHFSGPEYALPPLMSPRDFEEFVVKYDTRLVELIHSYPNRYVIIHSHGRVSRFLERFAAIGMDGLNVLEPPPIGDTNLADAKRRIGDRVCLIGNVQYDDLARGSKDQIERLVREAIRDGAPRGGFILCPCASPYERPLPTKAAENLVHYLRMGRKWGA